MALTTRFGIELPDVGADADAWGTILNNAFSALEGKVTDRTAGDTINGALTATSFSGDGANLTNLNASNLATGTVPDARFPLTLPAVSGANLTNLNASNLASGTVPIARLSGEYNIVAWENIASVSASVAANALTVTLNPTTLAFRSTTLSSGASTVQTVASAISLTVPSGATLGTINGIASRLVVLAIYTGTAVELAIVNLAGGNQLDETNLISTTAINTASDSANVIYSTTARTNVPYRVMGFVDSTQATAGTWASAPSLVQGVGGNSPTGLLYPARAWVNFNGTGTVAIRAAYNVSSITDNGVGDYTVNFTTPIPDANYSVSLTSGGTANGLTRRTYEDATARSGSLVRIFCASGAAAAQDHANVDLVIFR